MKAFSHLKKAIHAVLGAFLCVLLTAPGWGQMKATGKPENDAVRLWKRAFAVGTSLLQQARNLNFRIDKKRIIDEQRETAAIASGLRQMRLLRVLGRRMEPALLGNSSGQTALQTLKDRFKLLVQALKKELDLLNQKTEGGLKSAIQKAFNEVTGSGEAAEAAALEPGRIADFF